MNTKRLLIFFVLLGLWIPCHTWAMDVSGSHVPVELDLVVGKSIVVKTEIPVKRVSIADPEIADFVLLSRTQMYISGKKAGATNMILWGNGNVSAVYNLEVTIDLSNLKEKLHRILPDEEDLQVTATHDSIVLSGMVSSADSLSQVMSLAKVYAPEDKIVNLAQVAGVQQVMLEVRVAEMSRSLGKQLGFNFNYLTTGGNFGISKLNNLTQLVGIDDANIATPGAPFAILANPTINALFRFTTSDNTWTGFLDFLKDEGLIKILAEPTLIALSGQKANFLAGGEFPVPVPQGLGTVAIEYKSFGVGVSFSPRVLSNHKINMEVSPEVSELDFSTAIVLEGTVVPGLSTRRSSTVIELADGQSFAIAGLLKENTRSIISKFPVLGEIPVLGALFRSSSFQRNETELVIIVTPHLVKPLDMKKQTLPTDAYIEPNDTEFFLEGLIEGRNPSDKTGGLEGEFGHIQP